MQGGKIDRYVYNEYPKMTGSRKRELKLNGGKFKLLVDEKMILPKRTFVVSNTGDNGVLASKIEKGNIKVKNFSVLSSGKPIRYGGFNIMSLGGHYNDVISEYNKMKNCYFDSDDISDVYTMDIKKIHILLLNDVFGGKNKDGSFDLTRKVTLSNGTKLDLMDFIECFNVDLICLGDCQVPNPETRNDIMFWNFGNGDRTFISCQDMKVHCYIYDTEEKTVSYV
jgi:hypothetical protein